MRNLVTESRMVNKCDDGICKNWLRFMSLKWIILKSVMFVFIGAMCSNYMKLCVQLERCVHEKCFQTNQEPLLFDSKPKPIPPKTWVIILRVTQLWQISESNISFYSVSWVCSLQLFLFAIAVHNQYKQPCKCQIAHLLVFCYDFLPHCSQCTFDVLLNHKKIEYWNEYSSTFYMRMIM